jgi:hypothetical protein
MRPAAARVCHRALKHGAMVDDKARALQRARWKHGAMVDDKAQVAAIACRCFSGEGPR